MYKTAVLPSAHGQLQHTFAQLLKAHLTLLKGCCASDLKATVLKRQEKYK